MAGQTDAQMAIFSEIKRQVTELPSSGANTSSRANALKDLALAYRLAAGGEQPGSAIVNG